MADIVVGEGLSSYIKLEVDRDMIVQVPYRCINRDMIVMYS
jgi:hypothetical protein